MSTPQDYDFYEVLDKANETDKAWLLEVMTKNGTGKPKQDWYPKHYCRLTPHGDGLLVEVPTWLAKKKGICFLASPKVPKGMQNGGDREI